MTERKNIVDGHDKRKIMRKYGLIYTCNAGWIDLGHLNPENARSEIGAANLWKNLLKEGKAVLKSECKRTFFKPDECEKNPEYKFPDGSTGFRVRYRQDHERYPFKPGREGIYIVRHGLSKYQKKRVALAIFKEVSYRFESFQQRFRLVTDSGYSQDDLVSNLIGFYIGIKDVQRMDILKKCHPVSKESALALWDRVGAVGKNKNKKWTPRLAIDILVTIKTACEVECLYQSKKFRLYCSVFCLLIKGGGLWKFRFL